MVEWVSGAILDERTRKPCMQIEEVARGRCGGRGGSTGEREKEDRKLRSGENKRTSVRKNPCCVLPGGLGTKTAKEKG